MAIKQTRIFVPPTRPYDTDAWAETLLGRVIQPVVRSTSSLEWFWFSRYNQTREGDVDDCDISKIPGEFEKNGVLNSLRFRFKIADTDVMTFEQESAERIGGEGCKITDWRPYNLADDLGSERFVGEQRDRDRRKERAELIVSYLHSVSRLVLHSLVGPDPEGRFRLEKNDDDANLLGSSFESMHHLFCNITAVPWQVSVRVVVRPDGHRCEWGYSW